MSHGALRESIISAIISEAAGGTASPGPAVLTRVFAYVETEDLAERTPRDLVGAAAGLAALAAGREPGTTAVRVLSPSLTQDGWTSPRSVVQVVTNDSPFLVDSLTSSLAQAGLNVHLLVHPIMEETGNGPESWMHLEIDRLTGTGAHEQVAADVRRVLGDVAMSVADWPAMRAVCLDIVEELRLTPPSTVSADDVASTIEFLTWLTQDQFTFLGYREYTLTDDAEPSLAPVTGTGLGILSQETTRHSRLRPEALATAREPRLLTITKANSRSTVHRSAYLDYLGVRTFDEAGNVTGERRLLGLFTSAAYASSVAHVPIVADKVADVIATSGHAPTSHSGKDLHQILETYPRDELFQDTVEHLAAVAGEVVLLAERRRAKMFIRADEFGRFISVLVYMPRDRYSTAVRLKIEALLHRAFVPEMIDFTTSISDAPLAQVHLVVRMPRGVDLPQVDLPALQTQLSQAIRTWADQLVGEVHAAYPEADASAILDEYSTAFSPAYQDSVFPADALGDIELLRSLGEEGDVQVRLLAPAGQICRFKVASYSEFALTDVMPVLTDFGVQVVDEKPFPITRVDGTTRHVSDFGLILPNSAEGKPRATDFETAFRAVWSRHAESDALNALVLTAGLTWTEVLILRTLVRYAHQLGAASAVGYSLAALGNYPAIAAGIVGLFKLRFDPNLDRDAGLDGEAGVDGDAGLDARAAAHADGLRAELDRVRSADDDRSLRTLIGIVEATWRTNFYAGVAAGKVDPDSAAAFPVAIKVNCQIVPGMPQPHPMAEIWVYSPQVEGVHLRFSPVARGGLRWSDRREDFRTEVLGLVKAQMVKNAVIVPGGSKGGFVPKQLPSPADRGAWVAAGKDAYQAFVRALLDLTDNRQDGGVVPPVNVVRHDGDDPYLVVAADKGTAAFSDTANEISRDYGFWLDDAFASGGSDGYDHKAMAITARGAWESAKRHFRELGHDIQSEDFTAVGIGDMSGDVFGNGMRRSRHTKLIAAFDHRHIFIDPDPDPETSFVERERLYALPGSAWADYQSDLISAGGGVFERGAKHVEVTAQMRSALGLADAVTELSPTDLIKSILRAPVDLVYNGGIGTYIKASTESHADVGDPAGDSVRINANELCARVLVEGGNLGVSQLGRVEAAKAGVSINTDAIDNSAGVTTSDKEVNLKILFTDLIRGGALTLTERNELLVEMTDEVADQVLAVNYEQNVLLSNTMISAGRMLPVHQRLIHWLEDRGDLDRALEYLPEDSELDARRAAGKGLTQPEVAVVVAYAKLALKADLEASPFADDPWLTHTLAQYFPEPVRTRFAGSLAEHPLRINLTVNEVANSMVNAGGMTFPFRAIDETGADTAAIAKAYVAGRDIFDMAGFTAAVAGLDNVVSTAIQSELYIDFRRLLDRATRWFLTYSPGFDLTTAVTSIRPVIEMLRPQLGTVLVGAEAAAFETRRRAYVAAGVPADLATSGAGLAALVRLLDVARLAENFQRDPVEVASLYFRVADKAGFTALMTKVRALHQADRWASLARSSLRDDLFSVLTDLTEVALVGGGDTDLDAWFDAGGEASERALRSLAGALAVDEPNLSVLSVAVRKLRTVVERRQRG